MYLKAHSWAFIIWAVSLCALGALSVFDANNPSIFITALILPFAPIPLNYKKRLLLIFFSLISLVFGGFTFIFVVPLAFLLASLSREFILAFLILMSITLLGPHLQTIVLNGYENIPLINLIFIVIPAWSILFVFFSSLNFKLRILIILVPIATLFFANVLVSNWADSSLIANPFFRFGLAITPLVFIIDALATLKLETSNFQREFFLMFAIGSIVGLCIPSKNINGITFDESHGKWETVASSFTPKDFGRSANYTYSQLFKFANNNYQNTTTFKNESDPLPDLNSIFVLKMPTIKLSENFSNRLEAWVHDGGRLLVIADHTDLYDTTQILNSFLFNKFNTKINTHNVFDFEGKPNTPLTPLSAIFAGKINASNNLFSWQTGTSIEDYPFHTVELANFGLSYTEDGDYSKPNRFGPFNPTADKRLYRHSSVIGFKSKKGAVVIVLDSTPWSNFSIFIEPYPKLFKSIIHSLESPYRLLVIGVSGYLLLLLTILISFKPVKLYDYIAGLFLGITIVATTSQGLTSFTNSDYEKDYKLRVILGEDSKLEFLKQLLTPGDQNFTRIISALGKYDLMPVASKPGIEIPDLSRSKKWLLINPDSKQLPKSDKLVNHIKKGGNVTILFAPHQARSHEVVSWLKSLGIFTKTSIGLKVSDIQINERGSYLNGRNLALGREVNTVAYAKTSSLFKLSEFDQIFQSFSIRPTKIPKQEGLLTLSFVSDQFNDDVIGDVWEGIIPSSIGKLRERQLASLINEKERPELFPLELKRVTKSTKQDLKQYLVLEDGSRKILGTLPNETSEDFVVAKFQALRDQSENFVKYHCPKKEEVTRCDERFIDESYIEWVVSWRAGDGDKVENIELISDRRSSGLNSSLNIIFGR